MIKKIAVGIVMLLALAVLPSCSGVNAPKAMEQNQEKQEKAKLEVRDTNYSNSSGVVSIRGSVVNVGKVKAQNVIVKANVLTKQGGVAGEGQSGIGELNVGASRPFAVEITPTGAPTEIDYKVVAVDEEGI